MINLSEQLSSSSRLSRINTEMTCSTTLKERSSNLDLLDSKTLTSFPRPDIGFKTHTLDSISPRDGGENKGNDNLAIIEDYIKPVDSPIGLRTTKSTFSLYEQKKKANKMKQPYRSASSTKSSIKETFLYTPNITNNNKPSYNSSMLSYTKNLTSCSKNTTPPSSFDFQSEFYDYRLVLDKSNDKIMKSVCNPINEESVNTSSINPTTDLYIQSLYQDLNVQKSNTESIKCVVCDKSIYDLEEYADKVNTFHEIVCGNCVNDYNRLYHEVTEAGIPEEGETENYEEDGDYAMPIDIYSNSHDETDITVCLQFDTTIQTDDLASGNTATSNTKSVYGEENNEDELDDSYYADISFGNVIKSLKNIEKRDIKLRQSISDFRVSKVAHNKSNSGSRILNNHSSYNNFKQRLWDSLKRKFNNNS